MIKVLPETKQGLICLQASYKLRDEDYQKIIIPKIEEAIREKGKIRVILYMDDTFEGWEAQAMWDDTKMGLGNAASFEKFALVGGPGWIKALMYLFGMLTHTKIKSFAGDEYRDALEWIQQDPKEGYAAKA